jgi:hypothetical protein
VEDVYPTKDTVDCIIYYLTGFVCKKVYKQSQCSTCRQNLYKTVLQEANVVASLTEIKSRGGLNHPNVNIFKFFQRVEAILKKYINAVDVFDRTIDDVFSSKSLLIEFPCQRHQEDIISKLLYFFVCMRIKQFYKTEFKNCNKLSSKKKKESRLQSR